MHTVFAIKFRQFRMLCKQMQHLCNQRANLSLSTNISEREETYQAAARNGRPQGLLALLPLWCPPQPPAEKWDIP